MVEGDRIEADEEAAFDRSMTTRVDFLLSAADYVSLKIQIAKNFRGRTSSNGMNRIAIR